MTRQTSLKTTAPKVEIAPLAIAFQIGGETDELRKPHHENQMEIGKAILLCIEPFQTVYNVAEERMVLLFVLGDMVI